MVADNLNIWSTSSTSTGAANLVGTRKEGDMRQELINMFDGTSTEIPKAQRGVYRRMRTDSAGALVPCSCVDVDTGEPDRDPPCPFCDGMGYLWDEVWFDYYKIVTGIEAALSLREDYEEPGTLNVPRVTFYTKYDISPVIIRGQVFDRIVEVERDVEGNVTRPYRRSRIYRIGSAIDFRADNGRLEYWKFAVHSDDIDGRGRGSDV